ncbi:MAG: CAP domain-containing protein, partial [Thermoguttaceae bacterium]
SCSAPLPSPCEPVKQTVKESCETGACPLRGRVATAVSNFLTAANAIRAQHGLQALKADASLDHGSYVQANYCASTQRLIHGAGAAEILAQNYSGFDYALNQWLNSPAHRSLLLSPSYRFAGVATVRDASGRVWCAMRFK